MFLPSNSNATRYTPSEWFGNTALPPMNLRDLADEIVRVAVARHPDQTFTCERIDRGQVGCDQFPDLAKSVAVLELLRWVTIVDDAAPSSSGIRLSDIPEAVRRNRLVGQPWYIVEAFILVA